MHYVESGEHKFYATAYCNLKYFSLLAVAHSVERVANTLTRQYKVLFRVSPLRQIFLARLYVTGWSAAGRRLWRISVKSMTSLRARAKTNVFGASRFFSAGISTREWISRRCPALPPHLFLPSLVSCTTKIDLVPSERSNSILSKKRKDTYGIVVQYNFGLLSLRIARSVEQTARR